MTTPKYRHLTRVLPVKHTQIPQARMLCVENRKRLGVVSYRESVLAALSRGQPERESFSRGYQQLESLPNHWVHVGSRNTNSMANYPRLITDSLEQPASSGSCRAW